MIGKSPRSRIALWATVGAPLASLISLPAGISLPAEAALLASPPPQSSPGKGRKEGAPEREIETLVEEFRSADLFFQERAEGELRRRGTEALLALAKWLEDPDARLRLRLWPVFRDLLRIALDDLDADAGALFRDRIERQGLRRLREKLPGEITELRRQVEAKREPHEDPEEERRVAGEIAEKAQRLRSSEEALRDIEARLPEIEARMPDREKRTETGRKRILLLGSAAFGRIVARRESALYELVEHYDGLLEAIRAGVGEDRMLPTPESFDAVRYLLSTLWAREIDREGPLKSQAAALLERHLTAGLADLRSGDSLLRERAEEDFYALGKRGLETIRTRSSELSPAQTERLQALLYWRIEPGLELETGMDFRDYQNLPFRARRRQVIRYARAAGRAAIPTLRLIALDETREPSLRVRLAAAEALAGPNIRDRSAIQAFQRLALPELLKIPEIARDFTIINGRQLMDEKSYAEAIEEFRKVLDEAPYDFQANYWIAFSYLLMKNYPKAILHFEIARRVQPGDELTLYNLACAYSLDSQVEKALEALNAAVKAGFADHRHMEADPDLILLRTHPRFHELLDRMRQGTVKGN